MAKNKNFVKEITNMDEDFPRWYTDVIKKTDLVDYSPVKGFMVIKPYGYAIWENIQSYLDKKFKKTGHKNVYFPLLIPESLLNKEKEHVEGFAPEVAWVTHGGDKKLEEKLCVRPTSETIICTMYSKWLNSYRDLPFLYNQWCSVVRWEKETRPFLRTSEFLWQEGHTLHATDEEAQEETLRMLHTYIEMTENLLAIPVIYGIKSEKERFAGATATYTIEAMMHDGKALQSGTSHNLGQNFTKAFDIKYLDKDGSQKYPHHTSWGVSTRLIGALIMTHGDNRGLVLPPMVAPTQAVIIPIKPNDEKVKNSSNELFEKLKNKGVRVELDDSTNNSPGWKFNEYEMKGYPIRIELGPRDLEKNEIVVARRDTGEKITYSIDEFPDKVLDLLNTIQKDMLDKARKMREDKTYIAENFEDFQKDMKEKPGFYKAMWCGNQKCEEEVKEKMATTIRCIPDEQENLYENCLVCKNKAKYMVYFAKSY
ncbi:MAG: proline--tRNA ligase [Clostridiales bacterium]|nr:MAG: proline--tRNA ligase [Clostridiales bacterium]